MTTPLVLGGTTPSSLLTLQSTSGVGTSDAIVFRTGNTVERARFNTTGFLGLRTTNPAHYLHIESPGRTNGVLSDAIKVIHTISGDGGGVAQTAVPVHLVQYYDQTNVPTFSAGSYGMTSQWHYGQTNPLAVGSPHCANWTGYAYGTGSDNTEFCSLIGALLGQHDDGLGRDATG